MTTTPQAALLSRMDAYLSGNSCEATAIIKDARAILAKLQATQAEPVQAGEFPPLPVFSTSRVIQEAVEQYATDYARAALSARKPAVPAVEPMLDKHWYWISYEGLGHTYHAAAMYKANVDCFYSYEFSGVPAREVTVHHGIGLEVKP